MAHMDSSDAIPKSLCNVSKEQMHVLLGLSVKKLDACWAQRNTPLHELSDDLKWVQKQLSSLSLPELRCSNVALYQYDRLFDKYGPQIWSDSEQRYQWLLNADTESGIQDLYPRNLYYSNVADRDL